MLWELVGYVSEGGVDFSVLLGLDFEVLFVDLVYGGLLVSHAVLVEGVGWGGVGTDDSLRRRGARGPETELAQLLARLGGEGVESRFGGLGGRTPVSC